jgi:hypothetical protein
VQLKFDSTDHLARRRVPWAALVLSMVIVGFSVSPAAANPLSDCWERISVAVRHVPRPHATVPHLAVHKTWVVAPKRHKAHKVSAHGPKAPVLRRSRYILRPRACGTHEAMLTPMPGAVGPEAPELLLAELAGPATAPGVDVADLAPVLPPQLGPATYTHDVIPDGPGGFGGVTPTGGFVSPLGGGPGGGGPGGPRGPGDPRKPPLTPPVPPLVQPPSILPADGPGVPGGHGGPGVVPEPATWALLITGFFGVGTALRRRRARPA